MSVSDCHYDAINSLSIKSGDIIHNVQTHVTYVQIGRDVFVRVCCASDPLNRGIRVVRKNQVMWNYGCIVIRSP